GARHVVAERHGRRGADEHGAGVADPVECAVGVRDGEQQVLGCVVCGKGDRLAKRLGHEHAAVVRERPGDHIAPRLGGERGAAGESIATAPVTWSFASATYALPGPTMRSTGGMVSVPYAIAAMAPAPPTANTRSTFAIAAAARTSGEGSRPRGGEHNTTSPTPAARAGMAPMRTLLG